MSDAALQRAVRRGDGWYGFFQDVKATAHCTGKLAEGTERGDRPESLGRLEITVTPPPGCPSAESVERYAELGVDRLVLLSAARDLDDSLRFIEEVSRTHLA